MAVVKVSPLYNLDNRKAAAPCPTKPFGSVLSEQHSLIPEGIFCPYDPVKKSFCPTVFGLNTDQLFRPMRVCVLRNPGVLGSDMFDFVAKEECEVKILHTGAEQLIPGDNFTVTLPTVRDATAQKKHLKQYPSLCGGMLTVKKVQPYESDLMRQLNACDTTQALIGQLACPVTLNKLFAFFSLIRGAALGAVITNEAMTVVEMVLAGQDANTPETAAVLTILQMPEIKDYLAYTLHHAKAALHECQGFVLGEVLRPETGAVTRKINPGEHFVGNILHFY